MERLIPRTRFSFETNKDFDIRGILLLKSPAGCDVFGESHVHSHSIDAGGAFFIIDQAVVHSRHVFGKTDPGEPAGDVSQDDFFESVVSMAAELGAVAAVDGDQCGLGFLNHSLYTVLRSFRYPSRGGFEYWLP